MPEREIRAAREELTKLRGELHALGDKLDIEREARQKAMRDAKAERLREAGRIRTGHRRLIAAVILVALLGVLSTLALARVLNENEIDRCERTNISRQGTREVVELVYDDLARFPRVQQTPGGVEYIEGRRSVALDALDKSQPLTDCG